MADQRRLVATFSRLAARDAGEVTAALRALRLAKWIPASSTDRARRTVSYLLGQGIAVDHIAELATRAASVGLSSSDFPATARDPVAFVQAIYELAHLKYLTSLGKAQGAGEAEPDVEDDLRVAWRHRRNQSDKAKKSRSKVKLDGGDSFSVSHLVQELARLRDVWGDFVPTRELWPHLFSALDQRGLSPREEGDRYTYNKNEAGERGRITFGSFKAMISKAQKLT